MVSDPLIARDCCLVNDGDLALRALPSMAVVLSHPGFWLGDERTGVDAVRLVHGEQSIEIHRSLPVEGDVTRPEEALYYRLNGDDNPLQADPDVAARAGFPQPILRGLYTCRIVSHALLRGLGDYKRATLRRVGLRFSAPVFPGETIRTEIWRDCSFRALVAEREIVVVDHGLALFGAVT